MRREKFVLKTVLSAIVVLSAVGCSSGTIDESNGQQGSSAISTKIAHGVGNDYWAQGVYETSDSNSSIFYFYPNNPSLINYVILHYSLNGAPLENVYMSIYYQSWGNFFRYLTANVDLATVKSLSYFFTYAIKDSIYSTSATQYDTSWFYYNTNLTKTYEVVTNSQTGEAKITFSSSPEAQYAIVHYIVDNGPQMNVPMAKNNDKFEFSLGNYSDKTAVSYSFTFSCDGKTQEDTQMEVFNFRDNTPPTKPVLTYFSYTPGYDYFYIQWVISTDNVRVVKYNFYAGDTLLKDSLNYSKVNRYDDIDVYTSTTVTALGMQFGTTYHDLNIRAVDAAGNLSEPAYLTNELTPTLN